MTSRNWPHFLTNSKFCYYENRGHGGSRSMKKIGSKQFPDTVLKGQCHKIFCFRFFHESSFPKTLKITLGSFPIFLKIRKSRCTTCHRRQNCHWNQRHRRQILPTVPLVLLILCLRCQQYRRQISHQCQQHRWQITGTK
jgi:hypothetical protein